MGGTPSITRKAQQVPTRRNKLLVKRSVAQREADLVEIASLLLAGKTYRQIAEILTAKRPYSISYSQVGLDVKDIRAAWVEDQRATRNELIAQEVEFLRQIQGEAIEGYRRSRDTLVKTTEVFTGKRPKKTGKKTSGVVTRAMRDAAKKKQTISENRDGNPAFLAIAMKCSEARCNLMGLNPIKDVTPPPPPPEGGQEGETGVILLPAPVEEDRPPEAGE